MEDKRDENEIFHMKSEKHIVIAAIAAQQQGQVVNHVYDYSQRKYVLVNFTSPIGSNYINMFDYGRNSYVVGTLPSIYDYGSGSYINMNIEGNRFNGYDYESGSYFNGFVNGGMVTIFDYQQGRYFNFGI